MSVSRVINLIGATGAIRSATFNGKTHLVVPVVALVEGVLHAMNSPAPELVLFSEFSKVPAGWNGRPVMTDHPIREGQPVSANHPEVLESESIGQVFGTKAENNRLMMEAWIDVERAMSTEKGSKIVERLQKGEMLEVSVGTFVAPEKQQGIYNGIKYAAVWRGIVPDHLAFLSEGSIGACSNEMGCGTPRAAQQNRVTETGIEILGKEVEMTLGDKLTAFMKTLFKGNDGEEVTDEKIQGLLMDALGVKTEPVIASDCKCKEHEGDQNTMTKAERIASLTKKVNLSAAYLETCSDEQLTALEAGVVEVKAEEKIEPKVEPKAAAKTAEEYVAEAPVEIREFLSRSLAVAKAEKEEIVTKILAAKGNKFSREQLVAKPTDELELLAGLIGEVKSSETSFQGRGMSRPLESDSEKIEPAPTVASFLKH